MGQFKIVNNNSQSQSITSGDYVSFPKLTTTERNALVSVETGALINNITTNTIQIYNGSIWVDLGSASETITTINANYTATLSDSTIFVNATATITLPNPVGNSAKKFKIVSKTNGKVIINNVEDANFELFEDEILDIQSNNTNWLII